MMPAEVHKPSRNEIAAKVRDEMDGRRRFNEHYEVYVPEVVLDAGITMAGAGGGFQAGSTRVSLRVVVSWAQGTLAVDQVNDLQDHLEDHWVGADGEAQLDRDECRIIIKGEYTWDTWTREW